MRCRPTWSRRRARCWRPPTNRAASDVAAEEGTNPITTRSQIVLEIASALVAGPDRSVRQAEVRLRAQGEQDWALSLLGSSSSGGIRAVVAGRSHLAIVNPAASLAAACRGAGPWGTPQPVRAVAVIPSA